MAFLSRFVTVLAWKGMPSTAAIMLLITFLELISTSYSFRPTINFAEKAF
jgi:hypothetical protein